MMCSLFMSSYIRENFITRCVTEGVWATAGRSRSQSSESSRTMPRRNDASSGHWWCQYSPSQRRVDSQEIFKGDQTDQGIQHITLKFLDGFSSFCRADFSAFLCWEDLLSESCNVAGHLRQRFQRDGEVTSAYDDGDEALSQTRTGPSSSGDGPAAQGGSWSNTSRFEMKWNEIKLNEKSNDFKCVQKPTQSRLSLTHHANKSSRWEIQTLISLSYLFSRSFYQFWVDRL